jgi:hypothetical protein
MRARNKPDGRPAILHQPALGDEFIMKWFLPLLAVAFLTVAFVGETAATPKRHRSSKAASNKSSKGRKAHAKKAASSRKHARSSKRPSKGKLARLRRHKGKRATFLASNSLADQIVQFGQDNVGKPTADKTVSGPNPQFVCWDFVSAALFQAKAKGSRDFDNLPAVPDPNQDYTWASKALLFHNADDPTGNFGSFDQVQPGDVIQFRNVVANENFSGNDGKVPSSTTSTGTFLQHTALVEKNLGNGKVQVLEQNTNGRHFVTREIIDLGSMTKGKVWIYRPEKAN